MSRGAIAPTHSCLLTVAGQSCSQIRDKSIASSPVTAMHQVCAVVERTFTGGVKLPEHNCGFPNDGLTLEAQQRLVRQLLEIAMQYVSACKSKDSDRGMDSALCWNDNVSFTKSISLGRTARYPLPHS